MTMRYIIFLALLGMGLWTGPALAQNLANTKFSTFYDVAIAYSRLTNQPIDFDSLIISDPMYKKMSAVEQQKFLFGLQGQLQERYDKFTIGASVLITRVPVMVEAIHVPASMKIQFKTKDLPYFPFSVLGQTVSLMPEDLSRYILQPLDDSNEVKRVEYMAAGGATLVIEMLPQYASDKPVMIDNIEQHLILSKITRLRLLTGIEGRVIWTYTNPVYDHLYESGLGGLYGGTSAIKPQFQ
jgi:hypothetical protein